MRVSWNLILAWIVAISFAVPAAARTITVTTTGDSFDLYDGVCSLREALSAANDSVTLADAACGGIGDPGKDIVSLSGLTYSVIMPGPNLDDFWGDLDIHSEVELTGPPGGAIIEAYFASPSDGGRVMEIHRGARVILRNLTIISGNEFFEGGGIKNLGWLALDNVAVTQNTAGYAGGGIASMSDAELYLFDSTVSANTAMGTSGTFQGGGGIWAAADSLVGITDSTISANETYSSGGGIYTLAATASGGSLEITNSTISGNNARAKGGGIYHAGNGGVALSNATITTNTANSDNTPDNDGGGGGFANLGGGAVNLWNTIIAGNTNLFTGFSFLTNDCSGTLLSQGYNIIGSVGSCSITDSLGTGTDQLNVNPLLDTLADNGGPTQTHDLQAASPAMDAGNPDGCSRAGGGFLSTDQRGYIRPSGTRCDIGAVESQYPASRYIVDSNKDDGTGCTLREALTSILNGTPEAGCTDLGSTGVTTIEFAPAVTGTILLTADLPNVTKSLHIIGPGAGTLGVSGQGSYRSGLYIDDPGNTATVRVEKLAFIDGFAGNEGAAFYVQTYDALELTDVVVSANESTGGCVSVGGHLIVSNSTISNCTGRGISVINGSLEISGSSITDNVWSGNGGGIYLNASTMTATDSTFSNNVATEGGGALYINSGNLRIALERCSFTGNTAGYGGGIFLFNGELSILDTLIAGNSATDDAAPGHGGGIETTGSFAFLSAANSTFSGNSAVGSGGGLYLASGSTSDLANITVTDNTADSDGNGNGDGGGLAGGGSVAMRNSILSGNHDLSPANEAPDCGGGDSLVSGGFNLVGSQSGCASATWSGDDIFGTDSLLLPLADYGGPTLTHAILPPSPAVDGADYSNGCSWDHDVDPATGAVALNTDQRARARYTDGNNDTFNLCDIGAYEFDPASDAGLWATYATLEVSKAGTGSGTVTSVPAGIDCGTDCTELYNTDTSVSITAHPVAGSYFAGWSGDADCADGSVTMSADISCTATFSPNPVLTVAKSGAGSGTVTSSPAGIDCGGDCTETYAKDTVVTLSTAPAAGSYFAGWSGAADCTDGSVTMSTDISCTATFQISQHTLTVTLAGNGTGRVTSSPAGIDCPGDCSQTSNYGTTMTLTATPDTGWLFIGWSGDQDCLDGSITLNSDLSCTAIFADGYSYTVTSSLDDNGTGCTLREAINSAQTGSPADGCLPSWASGTSIIDFDPSVTGSILLGSNMPTITTSLHIQGPGSDILALDGQGARRSGFEINSPGNDATVVIEGLTLQNGNAQSGGGGAIYLRSGDALGVDSCVMTSNSAANGGALSIQDGILSLQNTTIAANTASGGFGGAIYVDGSSQLLVSLANTTISGNAADRTGGGIYYSGSAGEVRLANVTITDNTGDADADGDGNAGGVSKASPGDFFVRNSIIQGNHDENPGAKYPDFLCQGTSITSEDYNLFGDVVCTAATWGANDVFDTDPLLAPLADNGGPTRTHMLKAGSPAIDGANPGGCSWDHDSSGATPDENLATDQRGANRYVDGDNDTSDYCDIGAYEYKPSDPLLPKSLLCFPVKSKAGKVSIICF